MNRIKILLLLITISGLAFAGEFFRLIKTIPVTASSFTTDQFANSYLVSGNQIVEYDSLGNKKYSYSDNLSGLLKSIDVANPLQILLFYPDFAQVAFLDSKLSLQTKISLKPMGIQQPLLACTSLSGGFWVFDQQDFQLKLITDKLQVKYESGNISQALGFNIKPAFMTESGNRLYMSDPSKGIFVFDNFGTYLKTLSVAGIRSFQLLKDEILFASGNEIIIFSLKNIVLNPWPGPGADSSLTHVRVQKQKLFLLRKEKFEIWSF